MLLSASHILKCKPPVHQTWAPSGVPGMILHCNMYFRDMYFRDGFGAIDGVTTLKYLMEIWGCSFPTFSAAWVIPECIPKVACNLGGQQMVFAVVRSEIRRRGHSASCSGHGMFYFLKAVFPPKGLCHLFQLLQQLRTQMQCFLVPFGIKVQRHQTYFQSLV